MYLADIEVTKTGDETYELHGFMDNVHLSDKYASILLTDEPSDVDDVSEKKINQGVSDFLKILHDGSFNIDEITSVIHRIQNNLQIFVGVGLAHAFGTNSQGKIIFSKVMEAANARKKIDDERKAKNINSKSE